MSKTDHPLNTNFSFQPMNQDRNYSVLPRKAKINVDVSFMANRIREFYARENLCEHCIERGNECPYDFDIFTCINSKESVV